MALYDIVAAFAHTTFDEVVAVLAPDGLLKRDERKASKRWPAALHESVQEIRMAVMSGIFHHQDVAGMCGCHGDDFVAEGSGELLARQDVIIPSDLETKLLRRVGRPAMLHMKVC